LFTVIICGNAFLNKINTEHSHILDLLAHNPNCVICPWYPDKETFEEAVPGLNEITAGRTNWRALIIQDKDTFGSEIINKRNPFDVVDSLKALTDFDEKEINDLMYDYRALVKEKEEADPDKTDSELFSRVDGEIQRLHSIINEKISESAQQIYEYRKLKKANYHKAADNPLTRLTIWLSGAPLHGMPEKGDHWHDDLLKEDCAVDFDYYEKLYEIDLLPSELEQFRTTCYKFESLVGKSLLASTLRKTPDEVIVLSERFSKRADDIFKEVKKPHEELEYDNFCDDNMYPDKPRYILYDVSYRGTERVPKDFLSFSSFIYMLAINNIPDGIMSPNRVYNGCININDQKARRFFTQYLRKLDATKRLLLRKIHHTLKGENPDRTELTPEEIIALFESDVHIPVEIRSSTGRNDFMASKEIGLSKDCPRDEYTHWYNFAVDVARKFVRYIREPRRAVKHAVKGDFRDRSVIEDERVLELNEDRLEDIEFRLQEEELKMVETTTTTLFKTTEYTKRIDHADQVVRKGIAKRMTKIRTIVTGSIAILAFLFGFIPLLIKNNSNTETFMAALKIFGISFGGMVLAGLVFLFVSRFLHIRRIKFFNATMNEIFDEIENGLAAFSRYLSHACNVMREFSIFNYIKNPRNQKINTLKKHLFDVQTKIDGVNGLFVSVMEIDGLDDTMPYNFDFTKPIDYIYKIPYDEVDSTVEFFVKNNYVTVPIDYVKSVTITREELYD